ncbi:MAG: pyridoxal phosphate-dependent aminotransferase family protein, partial [Bacteroidales bacterium]|nr:pyridoxal phosphate-dependent aminotransferase family protein [Bacteroidales bacterium]
QTRPELREKLWTITNALKKGLRENGFNIGNTEANVTPVFLNGTVAQATQIVVDMRENYGIFCSMVLYPVVPKGTIELRLIPTAAHTLEDVERTINVFKEVRAKLDRGEYSETEINNQRINF